MSKPSRRKPGSIASEADRLTAELGFTVTPDQVRWWRSRGYDLQDTADLQRRLRNQQRLAKKRIIDPDEGVAYRVLSDEFIASVSGYIPVSRVLVILRDEWDGERNLPALYADKNAEEIGKIAERSAKFRLACLHEILGMDIEVPGAADLMREALDKEN